MSTWQRFSMQKTHICDVEQFSIFKLSSLRTHVKMAEFLNAREKADLSSLAIFNFQGVIII